jgi:MraZ protein
LSFTGEYRHTIDSKGRLIIPARIREQIEDDEVVLVIGPDGCVELWSGPPWREYEARLLAQRRNDSDTRSVVRRIAATAHSDRVDRQGRLHIPDHLLGYAGIDRDVVVAGSLNHVEFWSPQRWEGAEAGDLAAEFARLDL